jgi:hypothetical protein
MCLTLWRLIKKSLLKAVLMWKMWNQNEATKAIFLQIGFGLGFLVMKEDQINAPERGN